MPGEKDNAKMIRDVFRMLLSLKDSGVWKAQQKHTESKCFHC